MSLDKAIQHGKEHRKPYRRRTAKAASRSCRNHRRCAYCRSGRLHKNKRRMPIGE